MMKKLLIALLVLMLIPACALAETADSTQAPAAPTVESENGEMVEWIAPLPGEAVSLEKDMGLLVNNVFYPIMRPVDPLVEALGEPVELLASPSCVFEGEDKEITYLYGSIYTNPIEGADVWYDFYITDAGIATSRGLSVGDTVEKMLELYGDGYYSEGEGMYTYSLSGIEGDLTSPCLIFESEEGVIVTMDIYYPTNI